MPAPRLIALRHVVCNDATAFDAALLDRAGAVRAMAEWSAIVNAAQAACDMAAARVAECGAAAGSRSAEDEVARLTGTSGRKAGDRIRHGQRLRKQDGTRTAATAGKLSGDQAGLISDAVAANPGAERELLDTAARKSHAELRDECAKKKAAADPNPEAQEARIHAKRCLRIYTDAGGAAHLHATGTKRDMSRVQKAIEREAGRVFKRKRAEGVREPYEAYLFDGLVNFTDKGGDAGSTGPAIHNLALLRADWTALMRGHTVGDETCEIAGLGPIPVATARDMLGESIVKLVITKGVDVANVVHLGRGPIVAQRIALLWSRPRCTNEACGRMHHLEIDHRIDWADTHHTVLDELEPLCGFDHDLKTHQGWSLVDGKGPRAFVPPNHSDHPKNKRRQR